MGLTRFRSAEAIGVSKRYGATVALSNARLRVLAGKSHALVGRNGAASPRLSDPDWPSRARQRGNSLPRRASAGDRRPRRDGSAGCLRLPAFDDHPGPYGSRKPVHQPAAASARLHYLERALAGRPGRARSLGCLGLGTFARRRSSSVEARQLVEIARALSYGARFIILDEPTAQLDGEEIKRLFAQMRRLQAQGVTFCSFPTIFRRSTRSARPCVLRDAKRILTAPAAILPKDALIEAMTGEQVNFSFADAANRKAPTEASVALEVNGLGGEDFEDVWFSVRAERDHRALRRDEQRAARRGRGRGGVRVPYKGGDTGQRRPLSCGRRSLRAHARNRLCAEKPPSAGTRSHTIDRRQRHDADCEGAWATWIHPPRAGPGWLGKRSNAWRRRAEGPMSSFPTSPGEISKKS